MDGNERFCETIDEHTHQVNEAGTLEPLLSILEPAWDRDWFLLIGPDPVLGMMNGSVPDDEFRFLFRPPVKAPEAGGEPTAFGALVHWSEASRALLSGDQEPETNPLKECPIMVALHQVGEEQFQAFVASDSPESRRQVSAMLREAAGTSD